MKTVNPLPWTIIKMKRKMIYVLIWCVNFPLELLLTWYETATWIREHLVRENCWHEMNPINLKHGITSISFSHKIRFFLILVIFRPSCHFKTLIFDTSKKVKWQELSLLYMIPFFCLHSGFLASLMFVIRLCSSSVWISPYFTGSSFVDTISMV